MRPRVFPAEDVFASYFRLSSHLASMRPRVFPAEDDGNLVEITGRNGASMRPRVFPAEDADAPFVRVEAQIASMRPRVFPAEDRRKSRIATPACAVLQ